MPSTFAWVDFADQDRRRMAEVINLFREQDTRDELGIGVVRDALAELMFPGTSTIQTRARYFLFIPWIYRRHEERETPGDKIARKAREDEDRLIDALKDSGDLDGLIGIGKGAELQRPASSIYWAGLGTWGIRRFPGSQEQFLRAWNGLLQRNARMASADESDPDGASITPWDPGLPEHPSDFLKGTSFALPKQEAEYLQQRILALGQTLLGHLVSRTRPAPEAEYPWTHPEVAGFPEALQIQMHHARLFSEAMHGAALLYNLMLSEERRHQPWMDDYSSRFATWATLVRSRRDVFHAWNREDFWKLVEGTQARVIGPTRRFVDAWLRLALDGGDPRRLAEDLSARDLIRDREHRLKRARARLGNPRALERWNGTAGAQQLNYRWYRVRVIVADVLRGLGVANDA